MKSFRIDPIQAYVDNYIWCLQQGGVAVVVDPGDAAPVLEFLHANGLELQGILITHHHWDHVTGIEALLKEYPGIPVWGPATENIPHRTVALAQGDSVTLPWGHCLTVLDVPGHTLGHIAYYCVRTDEFEPYLLCGDTLFSSGCGRLFEGTAEQLWQSLGQYLALPEQTRVYCTHEYTLANLRFATAVEPDNAAIKERQLQVEQLRTAGQPSLPTSLALERKVNPFLRVNESSVIDAVSRNCGERPAGASETFAKLRKWKDRF